MGRIILVGGTGRSGTSIVKELLAAHPDAVSLPFEYRFIIDPDGLIDFYAGYTAAWSPYLADRKLQRLERLLKVLSREPWYHRILGDLIQFLDPQGRVVAPRAYHGWGLGKHLPNFDDHVDRLLRRLTEFRFPACWVGTESYELRPSIYHGPHRSRQELARILGDFVRDVINDLLEAKGADIFVEDNTWNILFAGEMLELLPDAKIVHVYRDPRDVVASFSEQRWSPRDKVQAAHWYKAIMEHWFEVRAGLPPESYVELALEDVVADPRTALLQVCKRVGMDLHPRMLELDLSHSHSGRWRREYTDIEKICVQEILGPVIERLGYGLEEA